MWDGKNRESESLFLLPLTTVMASRCRFTIVRNSARTMLYRIPRVRQHSMIAFPEMVLEESGAAKIESDTKLFI